MASSPAGRKSFHGDSMGIPRGIPIGIPMAFPNNFIGKSFEELHQYIFTSQGKICLGLYNNEENLGISEILSSDNSVLDRFIEKKLKEAGHSLIEQNKLNLNLNPNKSTIIQKNQGALVLK